MKWTHDCSRDGHRLEPRYDTVSPKWMDVSPPKSGHCDEIVKLYEKIYVCDVCTRCGIVTDGAKQPQNLPRAI